MRVTSLIDTPDRCEISLELLSQIEGGSATGHADARQPLLDASHRRETRLGPKHPRTLDWLRELVRLYESWNQPDEAAKQRAKRLEAAGHKG
jgi:hypothetical protein